KLIPYIQSYAERVKDEFENQISAIIQRECTSIHPAVQWRFEEEAIQYFQHTQQGEPATFHEVVFEDVVPLYGQIDIVGSSGARNKAIQKDLLSLLDQSKTLLTDLSADQKLPFYDQLVFQTQRHINSVKDSFHTNTEQQVSQFFEHQLYPLFEHAQTQSRQKTAVRQFLSQLDTATKSIYESRKQYDNTVDTINKKLSRFLDKKQKDAQAIFPHYFEKYKTDGIEHNLYIGQSITKSKLYHPSVMYNLRLWQLQVMCEMEAMYYKNQKEFAVPLNVASLVFAYDTPITIRYRIDEKKFDVDGAYNVRYEMIKKRIDKAHIKNTNERLTQPHMLSVVYSNPQLGREYMGYFEFLQSIGYIGKHIEKVELEELQGASGMMAIRAEMNHELRQTEKVFSLEDLKTMT
nr:hypothetical protein [Saprospiraceae bacterium]